MPDPQAVLFVVPVTGSPDGPEPLVVAIRGADVADLLMEEDTPFVIGWNDWPAGLYVWEGVVGPTVDGALPGRSRPATAADLSGFGIPLAKDKDTNG